MPISETAKVIVHCAEAIGKADDSNCDWKCYKAFENITTESEYVLGSQLVSAIQAGWSGESGDVPCSIPITSYMTMRLSNFCAVAGGAAEVDRDMAVALGTTTESADAVGDDISSNLNGAGGQQPSYEVGIPAMEHVAERAPPGEVPVYVAILIESDEFSKSPCLSGFDYEATAFDLGRKEKLSQVICATSPKDKKHTAKSDTVRAPASFGFTKLSVDLTELSLAEVGRYSSFGDVGKKLTLTSSSHCHARPTNVQLYYTANYTIDTDAIKAGRPRVSRLANLGLLVFIATVLVAAT